MVIIDIDDEVWDVYRRSWALMEVRGYKELVRFLEIEMWEHSCDVLEHAEHQLLSDEPEAFVRRAIGIDKKKNMSFTTLNKE
jgi:hypothetical protein